MSSGEIVNTVLSAVTGERKKDGSEKVEPKDFFWDQFVKYLSSAILALTVLNVTVQLFRDGGVSCFHPPDTLALLPSLPGVDSSTIYGFARDQASFLNNYCIGSIPLTEYFPIFILAHGLLLAAPHFIWSAIYKGDFDSFFSIAGKIDRLRDGKTGEYSKENFDRVQKLEVEYGGSNRRIFASYMGKLCLQLMVCGVSIGLSAGWLRDFSFSFQCPRELAEEGTVPNEWPLNATVPCVYTSLRILSLVRIADFILTAMAAVLIMYGLLWCVVRHTEQLGHTQVAKFAFESCLKPELYVFPPIVHFRGRRFLKLIQKDYEVKGCMRYVLWLLNHRLHSFSLSNCFIPRIRSDLDFLLLQLFRADASHGKVFKDIQVSEELRRLFGRDQQLLQLYINLQADLAQKRLEAEYREEGGRDIPDHQEEPEPMTDEEEEEEEEKRVSSFWGRLCCCKKRSSTHRNTEEGSGGASGRNGGRVEMSFPLAGSEGGTSSSSGVLTHRRGTNGGMQAGSETSAGGVGDEGGGGRERERERRKRRRRARWCALCLVCLCRCCLKKKPKKPPALKRRSLPDGGGEDRTDSARQNLRHYRDFRQIFLESGIGGNREKIAFEHFKPHLGNLDAPEVEESEEGVGNLRDRIYWFICEHGRVQDDHVPSNFSAVDVSFGTTGYPLVLSRAYREVVSVNFHPFYRAEPPDVVKEQEFFSNYYIITYPDDIYTRNNLHQVMANTKLLDHLIDNQKKGKSIDMIMVGPVANEPQKVSINIFLSRITLKKFIGKGGLLLALRPLRIGSKKVTSFKYEPSKKLFKRITKESLNEEEQKKLYRYVDGQKGYKVHCAGVSCIFEFEAYRYCGPVHSQPLAAQGQPNLGPVRGHPDNSVAAPRNFQQQSRPVLAAPWNPVLHGIDHQPSDSGDGHREGLGPVTSQEVRVDVESSNRTSSVSENSFHSAPPSPTPSPAPILADDCSIPSGNEMSSQHSLPAVGLVGNSSGAVATLSGDHSLNVARVPAVKPAARTRGLSNNASLSHSATEMIPGNVSAPASRAMSSQSSLGVSEPKATPAPSAYSSNSLQSVGAVALRRDTPSHDVPRLGSLALNGDSGVVGVVARRGVGVDKNSRSAHSPSLDFSEPDNSRMDIGQTTSV